MIIVLGIIKTIIAVVIMMLVGANLLGFVVRGFLWSPTSMEEEVAKIVFKDMPNRKPMTPTFNFVITLVAVVFTIAYFFALYHFWNIGLVVAAGFMMASRLPDLLWEIKNGVKVSRGRMPKGDIYLITNLLMWLSIPLTWYSLCKWPQ